jgi:hypothetical protein
LRKSRSKLIALLVLVAIGGVVYLTLVRPFLGFWEKTLRRFPGEAYAGELVAPPASQLILRDGLRMEAVPERKADTYVIVLREDDAVKWRRLLLAEHRAPNAATPELLWIRDLHLLSAQRRSDGWAVRFSCDWEWGGKEQGLIFLNPDYSFREVGISW